MKDFIKNLDIAVLIPCFNEEKTIEKVINDFRVHLPNSKIYVFDNCSTDDTASIARKNNAEVRTVKHIGKGNVVRRMFADIEADFYILVDGDDTYDASRAPDMLRTILDKSLDMVIGKRVTSNTSGEYRFGHVFGNKILTQSVSIFFGRGFTDMLSGYRVMSKRFVKSFPVMSSGFEIETEITIHSLQILAPFEEVDTNYISRPLGSESKLNTYSDGLRILRMIFYLIKDGKPMQFFSFVSMLFFLTSVIVFIPIAQTFIETGLVPRLPSVLLSTGLMILSFLSITTGIILDSFSKSKLENKILAYLCYPKYKISEK